ncbi:hypothetical protein M405DRAFT_812800, partial [Rhizopogon salebrosus TDB-379]
ISARTCPRRPLRLSSSKNNWGACAVRRFCSVPPVAAADVSQVLHRHPRIFPVKFAALLEQAGASWLAIHPRHVSA